MMPWRRSVSAAQRAAGLARLAWELPEYLRVPLDRERAAAALRQRLAHREERFLTALGRHLEARPSGPLARLLAWAGWTMADIAAAIRRDGIAAALSRLRDAGVYVTHDELLGTTALQRPGLVLTVHPTDFDGTPSGASLSGATSGSRSHGIRVFYTWDFLAEEAANESMLFAAHDLTAAPFAYWMPAVPALSGVHNLLFDLKGGRVPARWFAQVDAVAPGPHLAARAANSAVLRLAFGYVLWRSRHTAPRTPTPEYTPLADAERVATWLADTARATGTVVLKAYASAAVRVAAAARSAGLDLSGSVMLTGGEPLTESRRRFIEASGARVFARYVTTETGLVAGACAARQHTDEMHVWLDRLAIIPDTDGRGLLFTTVSPHAGKMLLNVDLGDSGTLERRQCTCALGALGLDLLVHDVRSEVKIAGEGVKLSASELHGLVAPLVEAAGGGPDDFQLWEEETTTGRVQLVIAVDPAVPRLDENALVHQLLATLKQQPLRGNLTGQLWEQGATVRVVRQPPLTSTGHKLLTMRRSS
jgi:hypothetical protein